MKEICNARVRVRIPDDTWAGYVRRAGGDEIAARGHVLSDAMVRLAHGWERDHWTPTEISDDNVRDLAVRLLVNDYFEREPCPYDPRRLLERWHAGAMMSPGQHHEITRALAWAREHLDEAAIARARADIDTWDGIERRYHEARAQTGGEGWDIEIVGPMPEQIGLCEYHPPEHDV